MQPWVLRGHAFHGGTGSGVFAFAFTAGSVGVSGGFRVVN